MKGLWRVQQRLARLRWWWLRQTRHRVTVPTAHGRLTVLTRDNVIARHLVTTGQFQHGMVQKVFAFLKAENLLPDPAESTVLDIGANIGFIAIGMLNDHHVARAVLIEADPTNVQLCEVNVQQNGLADRTVIVAAAASDRDGTLSFALSLDNMGDHRIRPDATGANVVAVPARTTDSIVESLPAAYRDTLALVWMDIQGHEGFAIRGGTRLFARRIPVVCEVSPTILQHSGMTIVEFSDVVTQTWNRFAVAVDDGPFVVRPIVDFAAFCDDLARRHGEEDVIFLPES